MMNGEGSYIMEDKTFTGQFVENVIEGAGTYSWNDGSSYYMILI